MIAAELRRPATPPLKNVQGEHFFVRSAPQSTPVRAHKSETCEQATVAWRLGVAIGTIVDTVFRLTKVLAAGHLTGSP